MDTILFYKELYAIKSRLAAGIDYGMDDFHGELKFIERRFGLRRHLATSRVISYEKWLDIGRPNESDLTVTMSPKDLDWFDYKTIDEYRDDPYFKNKFDKVEFTSNEEQSKKAEIHEQPEVEASLPDSDIDEVTLGSEMNSDLGVNEAVKSDLTPFRGGVHAFMQLKVKMGPSRTVQFTIGPKKRVWSAKGDTDLYLVVGIDLRLNALERVYTLLGSKSESDRITDKSLQQVRRLIGEYNYTGKTGNIEENLDHPAYKASVDEVVDDSIKVYGIGPDSEHIYSVRGPSGKPFLNWKDFNRTSHAGNQLTHEAVDVVRTKLYSADSNKIYEWLKSAKIPVKMPGFLAKFDESLADTDVLKAFFDKDPDVETDSIPAINSLIKTHFSNIQGSKGKELSEILNVYEKALAELAGQSTIGKDISAVEIEKEIDKARNGLKILLVMSGAQVINEIKDTVEKAGKTGELDKRLVSSTLSKLEDPKVTKLLEKHLERVGNTHRDFVFQETAIKKGLNRLDPGLYGAVEKAFKTKGITGGVHGLMTLVGSDKNEAIDILDRLSKKYEKTGAESLKFTLDAINSAGMTMKLVDGRKSPSLMVLIKNISDVNTPLGYSMTDPQYSSRTAWKGAQYTSEINTLLKKQTSLSAEKGGVYDRLTKFRMRYWNLPKTISAAGDLHRKQRELNDEIDKDYSSSPLYNPDASLEEMLHEVEDDKLRTSYEALQRKIDDKIDELASSDNNDDPVMRKGFPDLFAGKDTFVSDAYAKLNNTRKGYENEENLLKEQLSQHISQSAKPFVGFAGNPMAQLNDFVHRSMGTSIKIRKIDDPRSSANLASFTEYLKSNNPKEWLYAIIGMSYKGLRGASSPKIRKPSKGRSIYDKAEILPNKSLAVSRLNGIKTILAEIGTKLNKFDRLQGDISNRYKMDLNPDVMTEDPIYLKTVSDISELTRQLSLANDLGRDVAGIKLEFDRIAYLVNALQVYVNSPRSMVQFYLIQNINQAHATNGSMQESIKDNLKEINDKIDLLKKSPQSTRAAIFANKDHLDPAKAHNLLYRVFNWAPKYFGDVSSAIIELSKFSQGTKDDDHKNTPFSRWMSGIDASATCPDFSSKDIQHAVHILLGYLDGSYYTIPWDKSEHGERVLDSKWKDYILKVFEDDKTGRRHWTALSKLMNSLGLKLNMKDVRKSDVGIMTGKETDPEVYYADFDKPFDQEEEKRIPSGRSLAKFNLKPAEAWSEALLGYAMFQKFPPDREMLQHIHAYLKSPNGAGVKEILDEAVFHTPELHQPPGVTSKSTVLDMFSGKSDIDMDALVKFASENVHHVVNALTHHIGRGSNWESFVGSLKSKIIPGYKDPMKPIAEFIKKLRDSAEFSHIKNKKLFKAAEFVLKPLNSALKKVDTDSTPLDEDSIRAFMESLPSVETTIKSKIAGFRIAKVEDNYDHSENRHETKLGGDIHNWDGPAVDMIELDGKVISPEFWLFSHKYQDKSSWEADKTAFDTYVDGIVGKVQDLISKSSTLKINPS